jgi:hypothetical protein
MHSSCVASVLVLLIAGYDGSSGDELMKEFIRLKIAHAEALERLAAKPSADEIAEIKERLAQIDKERLENDKELQKVPFAEKKALGEKYKAELVEAMRRFAKALPKKEDSKKEQEASSSTFWISFLVVTVIVLLAILVGMVIVMRRGVPRKDENAAKPTQGSVPKKDETKTRQPQGESDSFTEKRLTK